MTRPTDSLFSECHSLEQQLPPGCGWADVGLEPLEDYGEGGGGDHLRGLGAGEHGGDELLPDSSGEEAYTCRPPCGTEAPGEELPGTPAADGNWSGEVPPMPCWFWGQEWGPQPGQGPVGAEWGEWSNWCENVWPNQEGEDWGDVNVYPGMGGPFCDGQQGSPEWLGCAGGWDGQGWQDGMADDDFSRSGRPRPTGWRSRAGRSHIYVPRRLNLVEKFWDRREEEVTTVMIRNVPNQYHRGMLMQELDTLGFRGKYDFVYLPIDNATFWNVGYAFVNFEDSKDAIRCMNVMEGHEFLRFRPGRKRVAQVSVAHIQGLEQNLAHCSGTSVFSTNAPWLRPWVRKRSKQWQQPQQYPSQRHPQEDFPGQPLPQGGQMTGPQAGEGYGLHNVCNLDWEWMGHGAPSPGQTTRVPSYPSVPNSPPSLAAPEQGGMDGASGPAGYLLPPSQDEIMRGRGRGHPGQVHPHRDMAQAAAAWAGAVSRTPSPSPDPCAASRAQASAHAMWEVAGLPGQQPMGTPPNRSRSPGACGRSTPLPCLGLDAAALVAAEAAATVVQDTDEPDLGIIHGFGENHARMLQEAANHQIFLEAPGTQPFCNQGGFADYWLQPREESFGRAPAGVAPKTSVFTIRGLDGTARWQCLDV